MGYVANIMQNAKSVSTESLWQFVHENGTTPGKWTVKGASKGESYMPIPFLTPVVETFEAVLLSLIGESYPVADHQQGFRHNFVPENATRWSGPGGPATESR